MKRVRYQSYDGIHWGELEGGKVHQLNGMMGRQTGHATVLSDVTLLAPCEPKTIICVGKNYADHVAEMGGSKNDLPKEPGLFLKSLQALSNPGDPIPYPSWTDNLHYEGELAIVISRKMKNISMH